MGWASGEQSPTRSCRPGHGAGPRSRRRPRAPGTAPGRSPRGSAGPPAAAGCGSGRTPPAKLRTVVRDLQVHQVLVVAVPDGVGDQLAGDQDGGVHRLLGHLPVGQGRTELPAGLAHRLRERRQPQLPPLVGRWLVARRRHRGHRFPFKGQRPGRVFQEVSADLTLRRTLSVGNPSPARTAISDAVTAYGYAQDAYGAGTYVAWEGTAWIGPGTSKSETPQEMATMGASSSRPARH